MIRVGLVRFIRPTLSSCMFLRMFLLSFWRQIAKFKIRNLKTLCVPEWRTKSVVKISWNRCVHGFVQIRIIQVMNSKSISSPARLVHQCIDSIFGLVSLQISEHGFKTALPHLEPFLAQLPRELQVNNFHKVSFVYHFINGILFHKLFFPTVRKKNQSVKKNWKNLQLEINQTIWSNSERSVQFLK